MGENPRPAERLVHWDDRLLRDQSSTKRRLEKTGDSGPRRKVSTGEVRVGALSLVHHRFTRTVWNARVRGKDGVGRNGLRGKKGKEDYFWTLSNYDESTKETSKNGSSWALAKKRNGLSHTIDENRSTILRLQWNGRTSVIFQNNAGEETCQGWGKKRKGREGTNAPDGKSPRLGRTRRLCKSQEGKGGSESEKKKAKEQEIRLNPLLKGTFSGRTRTGGCRRDD